MNHWEAGHNEHPSACSCATCNRRRLAKLKSRPKPPRVPVWARRADIERLLEGIDMDTPDNDIG